MPVIDKNLNSEFSTDITAHFPFPTQRATQTQAMTGVQSAFRDDNKKFYVLEGPTGFGKSGVGIAACSWAKTLNSYTGEVYERGGYILSPQKVLTKQYVDDFASLGLVELKGQANYTCHGFTEQAGMEIDCETAAMLYEEGHNFETCTGYKPAKRIFQQTPMGVTNFDYYLNETMHAGQLKNRNMLVLDEAHNCENKILGFADTVIDKRRCEEYGVVGGLPIFSAGYNEDVANWLHADFVPAYETHKRNLKSQISVAKETGDKELAVKLLKRVQAAERFMGKVNMFLNSEDRRDWLAWSDWDAEKRKGTTDLAIKPLTATLFANDILFSKADKVLLMSATILDFPTFMRNLGIDPSKAACLAVDSEFPLENRPIFFKPCGNMGFRTKKNTLPKMAAFMAQILRKYATKKGIIHTHSYENNRYFVEFLKAEFGYRIITHDNSKGSRDRAVMEHISSPEPTVLFSPSMTEGLDLKEDLARFCVVTKVPYPFMDPYVKARMQRDPAWYQWLTALVLEQATGRVVRSSTDKAHTYILDEGFRDFYNKNQCTTSESIQLSKWWTDSIIGLEAPDFASSF
jgi:Rad3-related DNA helicase